MHTMNLNKIHITNIVNDFAKTESGFGRNISNWIDRKKVYPTNVLNLATECGNRNHSAVFPKELPEWFIKLFTKENDTVLDPFAGSGTTLYVANKMQRNSIGVEIVQEYYERIRDGMKLDTEKTLT